jgi:hypothetical protein
MFWVGPDFNCKTFVGLMNDQLISLANLPLVEHVLHYDGYGRMGGSRGRMY